MSRRAFTLIEVVVALGLMLVLVTTLSSIVSSVVRARSTVHERLRASTGVGALFELLGASADTCTARGRKGAAGITGTATTLLITRAAHHARDEGLDPLEELSFSFEEGNVIVSSSAGVEGPILRDVGAIEFRFFDGVTFHSMWKSATDGLPLAIELSIWSEPLPSSGDRPAPDYRRLVSVLDAPVNQGGEL